MKRILCLILSVALLLGLCGCSKVKEPQLSEGKEDLSAAEPSKELSILYCSGDSLNPYLSKSALNRQLGALLYEPLVRVNDVFEAEYRLAESVTMDGNVCTVVLKSVSFTDGSSVTADDVVYSYQQAKASGEYAMDLYEVQSASAVDGRTVQFRLTRYDPYFVNLLEFPVIKAGSDQQTDIDGVVLPPVGCGRYVVDGESLLKNEGYYGEKSRITKIKLINAPDEESISHYVEVGATDLYFTDLSDGNIVRMSGKRTDVNLNHLVYIGLNAASSGLSEAYLRYAISSALDRTELCKTAYFNNAVPANGFFHPEFSPAKSVQTIKKSADLQIAIENLSKVGYNNLDENGYRCNSAGKPLSLTLLVNSDNPSRLSAARMIAEQLKQVGIQLTLIERDYASYMAAISAGQFQLYLGEIRILKNMDLSQLTVPGGSAAYGVADVPQSTEPTEPLPEGTPPEPKPATVGEVLGGFYSGNKTVADVASVLLTKMPVVPVLFRKGLLFYSEDLRTVASATPSDLYISMAQF